MLSFLKNQPFAVEAHFESSIVLTFAVRETELRCLIAPCLELDTFEEDWGFIAVAMVQTKALRPKGLPRFLGSDFFLIGYRVFVRFTNDRGKRMRGLYILRSETDSRRMEFFGNIFTHYAYSTIDITIRSELQLTTIESETANLKIVLNTTDDDPDLPALSPFSSWKEARRFAGPLPFTFTFDPASRNVLIVEGVRQQWSPRPIEVVEQNIGFIRSLGLQTLTLANAFIVEDVPYYWKKGGLEKWRG
ncbi:MAG TPA: DUF2071 domain-containing protein [Pyrinomonadaceae bacterium]